LGRALHQNGGDLIVENKTEEQVMADWITTQNIARFQEMLKGETDEGRHRILEGLLRDQFRKFGSPPSP
jgi:hypothetical protein